MTKLSKLILSSFIITPLVFGVTPFVLVAQAGVPVIETNPSVLSSLGITSAMTSGNLAKRIQEFIFKLTTENLKRKMLDAVVNQMITGVAGGQPKFVTNWEEFNIQNYNLGKNEAISNLQNSGVLGGDYYDNLISAKYDKSVSVGNVTPPTSNSPFSYKKYLNSWQPENNYYGKSLLVDDYVKQQAQAKAEAAKNEAVAGGGYLSSKDAAGTITTPGKTLGDTISRAITSDIDYIVNADDLTSFMTAVSSSVFNKLLDGQGLAGLAQGVLSGDGIGSLTGGVLNLSNGSGVTLNTNDLGQIIFNSDNDSSFEGVSNSIPRNVSDTSNIINEEINDITSEITLGDIGLGSDTFLDSYEQNKKTAFKEVQNAIWYLEDLQTANGSTTELTKTITRLEAIRDSVSENLGKVNDIVNDTTNRQISAIQQALLKDIYSADLTFELRGNFDIANTLPLNLNSENTTSSNQINRIVITRNNSNFFINEISYSDELGVSSGGSQNYLGINIPDNVTSKYGLVSSPSLYLYKDNLANYLSALNKKIDIYESEYSGKINKNNWSNADSLTSAYNRISKIDSLKSKINSFVAELYKTKLYLADTGTMTRDSDIFKLLDILQYNIDLALTKKSSLFNLSGDNLELELDYFDDKLKSVTADGVNNLYTAGLIGSGSSDTQGKLPIITNSVIANQKSGVEISGQSININDSLLPPPYNGSNFLGSSNSTYYWLADNYDIYKTAIESKINSLITSERFSSLPSSYQEVYLNNFDNLVDTDNPYLKISMIALNYWKTQGTFNPNSISLEPITIPASQNIKLRFYRHFSDKEIYDKGYLGQGLTDSNYPEIFIDSLSLEKMYQPKQLPKSGIIARDEWAYREYDISKYAGSTINIQCKATAHIYSATCGLDNVQIISY